MGFKVWKSEGLVLPSDLVSLGDELDNFWRKSAISRCAQLGLDASAKGSLISVCMSVALSVLS